ncbi:MAG: MarR family transcriptional regulator, partial [Desulfofustis sp.]|nr:MarR family transcriptional regulator [Desulfofustis sp.]
RKPHEHDRRAWLVVLTKLGKKMYDQHNKYHEEFTQEISFDLTANELKTLTKLMARILQRM